MSEQRSQEAVEGEGFTRSWALFMWISPLIAIAVIYARVRFNEFVWDDPMLSLLPVYRDCDLGRILTSAVNGFEYLPVRDLSLCVDHALFGSEPAGFHLMNVLIFMASALLVQRVLRSLFALAVDERIRGRSAELSWICTLLFCVHPLQVEPVSFVSCRNTLLALLFVMASLAAFCAISNLPIACIECSPSWPREWRFSRRPRLSRLRF
jgi:hypothetical protein